MKLLQSTYLRRAQAFLSVQRVLQSDRFHMPIWKQAAANPTWVVDVAVTEDVVVTVDVAVTVEVVV